MKTIRRILAALVSFLTGVPALTPRQRDKLAEIDREQADWPRPRTANPPGGAGRKL